MSLAKEEYSQLLEKHVMSALDSYLNLQKKATIEPETTDSNLQGLQIAVHAKGLVGSVEMMLKMIADLKLSIIAADRSTIGQEVEARRAAFAAKERASLERLTVLRGEITAARAELRGLA